MRAVVQRVKEARVTVDGRVTGKIEKGLLVLLGVMKGDTEIDAHDLAQKVLELRIFEDDHGKMNRGLQEIGGSLLVVSQFTLAGDCRKGRRPSFDDAADALTARTLYEVFVEAARSYPARVETGEFQAMMEVCLINDGPVTILLDSRKLF
jgi:D-aminoacyl-tRNA deacylase